MEKFDFGKDILGFISILITIFAVLLSLVFQSNSFEYLIPLIIVLGISGLAYIINYFRLGIEIHEKRLNKLDEKINIYKDISDLKAKVDLLFAQFKMNKRGQIEVIIKVIQIGAILVAGYFIITALNNIS